jgi:hypothetical protein
MNALKRLVSFAGWYSVIGGMPLAVPFLTRSVGLRMGLTGSPAALLLANTAGLLMVFMGLMLLFARRDLEQRAGIVVRVAVARLAFSALVLCYALSPSGIGAFWIVDAAVDTACSVALLCLLAQRRRLLRGGGDVERPKNG